MNFLEVYFNGVLKQSLPMNSDIFSIGRAASNDVIINNRGVSNHHAVISKKNDVFCIEDLNSTNGTFLNSQKISSQLRINPNDSIIIGKHILKFSEWSQSQDNVPANSINQSDDATMMMDGRKLTKTNHSSPLEPQQKTQYLIVRGELNGKNKLLLTENSYGIGKAKDNEIRIGGWFTPAYIAEIEKIGHSFYITPLKKNKVKLNHTVINSSTLLSPSDEIRIKKLLINFLAD